MADPIAESYKLAARGAGTTTTPKPQPKDTRNFTQRFIEATPEVTGSALAAVGKAAVEQLREGERISKLPIQQQFIEQAKRTGNVFAGVASFLKGAAQGTARTFAGIGLDAQGKDVMKENDITRFLFGEGDVTSISKQVETGKEFVKQKGGNPLEVATYAPLAVIGMTALDVAPLPAKTSLIKQLVKETSEDAIQTALKTAAREGKLTLDDFSINLIKKDIANSTNARDISKYLTTGQKVAATRGVQIAKAQRNKAELGVIHQELKQIVDETPALGVSIDPKAKRAGAGTVYKDLSRVANKIRHEENKRLVDNIRYRTEKKAIVSKFKARETSLNALRSDLITFARANLTKEQFRPVASRLASMSTRGDLITGLKDVINQKNRLVRREAIASIDEVMRDMARLPVHSQDLLKQAMDGMRLKRFGKSRTEQLTNLKKFLEENPEKVFDFESRGNLKDVKALKEIGKKPVSELTTDDLLTLANKIQTIRREGLLSKRIRDGRVIDGQRFPGLTEMRIERDIDEIASSANNLDVGDAKDIIGKDLTPEEQLYSKTYQALNGLRKGDLNYHSTDVNMNLADGMVDDGAHARLIKQPLDDAIDTSEAVAGKMKREFVEEIERIRGKYKLEKITDAAWERIFIHAMYRQEGGIKKLLRSGVSRATIEAHKTLTGAEKELYDYMRGQLDDLYTQVDSVHRSLYDKRLDNIANYFPTRAEYEEIPVDLPEDFGSVQSLIQDNYNRKNVERGFTKQRTATGARKYVMNARDLYLKHIADTNYFVHVQPALERVAKITGSEKYKAAVGNNMATWMKGYVDIVARKGVPKGYQYNVVDALKRNVGAATLGFNPSPVIKQPLSKLAAMGFLGKHSVLHDVEYFSNYKTLNQAIEKASVQQKVRALDDPSYVEFSANKKLAGFQERGYRWIKATDKATANNVWYSAYKKHLEDNGMPFSFDDFVSGKVDDGARKYADKIVRITQGTGKFKDLPGMFRNKDKKVWGTIMQFQSFAMNQSYIMSHYAIRRAVAGKISPVAAVGLTLPLVASAVGSDWISTQLSKLYGNKEYAKEKEKRSLAEKGLDAVISLVPPISIAKNFFTSEGTGVPAIDTVKTIGQAFDNAINAKTLESRVKGWEQGIESILKLGGVSGAGFAGTLSRRAISGSFETPTDELVAAIKAGDKDEAKRILKEASDNGLKTGAIMKNAKERIKRDIKQQNKTTAEKILNEVREMSPEQRKKALLDYKQKGVLTGPVIAEMRAIMKSKAKKKQLGEYD